jgi:hypothetical protein
MDMSTDEADADMHDEAATRQNTAFNTMKRTSNLFQSARAKVSPIGARASRAYSSEMANAMVQVSQNIGMGNAAIGLGGVSVCGFRGLVTTLTNGRRLVSVSVWFSLLSCPLSLVTHLSVASSSLTPFWGLPSSRPSVW